MKYSEKTNNLFLNVTNAKDEVCAANTKFYQSVAECLASIGTITNFQPKDKDGNVDPDTGIYVHVVYFDQFTDEPHRHYLVAARVSEKDKNGNRTIELATYPEEEFIGKEEDYQTFADKEICEEEDISFEPIQSYETNGALEGIYWALQMNKVTPVNMQE